MVCMHAVKQAISGEQGEHLVALSHDVKLRQTLRRPEKQNKTD